MIESEITRPVMMLVIVFGMIILYKYLKAPKHSHREIGAKKRPDKG